MPLETFSLLSEQLQHLRRVYYPVVVEFCSQSTHRIIGSVHNKILVTNRMLFSLLSWNPPNKSFIESDHSENTNPNIKESAHRQEKSNKKAGLNPIVADQLEKSANVSLGRLKHRDAAILIMRVLVQADSSIFERSASFNCREYLTFLDKLEQLDPNPASFGTKHVLGIEGLEHSGKSTLIESIKSKLPKAVVVKHQEIPDVITRHSETASIVWEFLENYRIAMEILESEGEIFLVENYYHHFLTKYLQVAVNNDEDVNNIPYCSFAWPHDLPMPELVLFLTTSTSVRLARLEDTQEEPKTIVPYSKQSPIIDHEARDVIANNIFAAIRGPSTVGIDTTPAPLSVFATVIEALDYFGFYSVSRGIAAATAAQDSQQQPSSQPYADPMAPYQHTVTDEYSYGVSTYFDEAPMLPADVISNRRISMGRVSMGVYGMYSRF